MTASQRKFQGVWIPADLWLDHSLSITEKVMLVEIGSLQDDERGCYASNAHFAKFFGLSPSRVSEIITGLANKGLVTVELIREGKRIVERRIRITDPFEKPKTYSEKAEKGIRLSEEGYSEKAEGSNTRINNTERDTYGASAPCADPAQQVVADQPAVTKPDQAARTRDAFELFWKASTKMGSKKKAAELFASICKREKRDPKEFSAMLAADVMARLKAGQFGFDKLHVTTYLNQERWLDEMPKANSAKPSIAQNFKDKDYRGTPDDQFADFLQ